MYSFQNLNTPAGTKAKLQANIEAVKLLKDLEHRNPTSAEKDILAQFVGWGTVASAINKEVLELLPNADLNSDNAFQTSKPIIEAMWEVLAQLGFTSGRILEPSANIGLFPGLQPITHREKSEWCLVEIDPTASAIAKHLHTDAIVYPKGFEKVPLPSEFDLVIGNFPFGRTAPFDPNYSDLSLTLHNYFWLKSFDCLRVGGLVAAITSTGTLDTKPERFCQMLAEKGAKLIDAVRLPNTAFKDMGTSVTADLIILQKSASPQSGVWLETVESAVLDNSGNPIEINRYFAENPDKVLGTLANCTLYDGDRIAVKSDGRDIKEAILKAFDIESMSVYKPLRNPVSLRGKLLPSELIGINPYSFLLRDGKVYQLRPTEDLVLVTLNSDRVKAGLALKSTLTELVEAEVADRECEVLRSRLNSQYDQFVKQYGNLLNPYKKTLSIFRDDSELYSMLFALEEKHELEDELSAEENQGFDEDIPRTRKKLKKEVYYTKADIFYKKVSGSIRTRSHAITQPIDAVHECLDSLGYLDIKRIAAQLDKSEEDAILTLKAEELIFFDPQLKKWVAKEEYVSGDTRAKLRLIRTIKQLDPQCFAEWKLADNENILTRRDSKGRYVNISPYLLPPASAEIKADIAHRLKIQFDIDCDEDPEAYIRVGLGANFLSTQDIKEFAAHIIGSLNAQSIKCDRVPGLALWAIKGDKYLAAKSQYASEGSSGNGKMDALKLLEHGLNHNPIKIKITRKNTRGEEYTDHQATEEATNNAVAALERIRTEFKQWLWQCPERAWRITQEYNRLYPRPLRRTYDGSFLTLPDSNGAIKLRTHQLNAVARMRQTNRCFLLHEVGVGKTFSLIAGAYESKRLGKANKPLIVVLKATLGQFAASYRALYPNAKLLIADEDSFNAENRNKLIAKIQTGDYDSIIMTHDQFYAIPISFTAKMQWIEGQLKIAQDYLSTGDKADRLLHRELERQVEDLQDQLDQLKIEEEIATVKHDAIALKFLLQQLEADSKIVIDVKGAIVFKDKKGKHAKKTEKTAKVLSQKNKDKKRDTLSNSVDRAFNHYTRNTINIEWEQLGIDWINFDEFHALKNKKLQTKQVGTAGITNSDTQRTLNCYLKFRQVYENGGFIGGATGTYPTSSITELYNLLDFFAFEELKSTGTEHFDSWCSQFAESTTELEFTSTGGLKQKTRISRFKNLPILMDMLAEFTDFATADSVGVPRPDVARITITAPLSNEQDKLNQIIAGYMEQVRRGPDYAPTYTNKEGRTVAHNPLTLTGMGSAIAIDPRLVYPKAKNFRDSKLNKLIHNVFHIWDATEEQKLTQIIFCDASTPKTDGSLNTYQYIKDALVALGKDPKQIAFIHDYEGQKRARLFERVTQGEVRVMIASTQKGGTGVNVQGNQKLLTGGVVAVHHLDLQWTPASMEQRNGRAHRQGNPCKKTWQFYYGTSGKGDSPGFDAYKFDLVRKKAAMNFQIMSGKVTAWECEDIGADASTYMMAAAALSGKTEAIEHAKVLDKLRKLDANDRQLGNKLFRSIGEQKEIDSAIAQAIKDLADATADQEQALEAGELTGKSFKVVVEKRTYKNWTNADEAFKDAVRSTQGVFNEQKLGGIAGFSIIKKQMYVYLAGKQDYVTVRNSLDSVRDKVKDIAEGKYVDEAKDQLAYLEKRKVDLPSEITKLSAEVEVLKHEIKALVAREKEIKAILTATKKEDEKDKPKETVKLTDGVLAPVPAIYKGVEPKIVNYIKSLPEPTSIDTDKMELRWIDEMRNLGRTFVESTTDVEVARQKLEQVYQSDRTQSELSLNLELTPAEHSMNVQSNSSSNSVPVQTEFSQTSELTQTELTKTKRKYTQHASTKIDRTHSELTLNLSRTQTEQSVKIQSNFTSNSVPVQPEFSPTSELTQTEPTEAKKNTRSHSATEIDRTQNEPNVTKTNQTQTEGRQKSGDSKVAVYRQKLAGCLAKLGLGKDAIARISKNVEARIG